MPHSHPKGHFYPNTCKRRDRALRVIALFPKGDYSLHACSPKKAFGPERKIILQEGPEIIPRYAPAADHNDEWAYIHFVEVAVDTWRAKQVNVAA